MRVSNLRVIPSLSSRMLNSLNLFFFKILALKSSYLILSQQLMFLKVEMLNQKEVRGWEKALGKACSEAEWLQNLLVDLLISVYSFTVMIIHCNYQATIIRTRSEIYKGKNRNIHMRHNIVKHLLESSVMSLDFVRS